LAISIVSTNRGVATAKVAAATLAITPSANFTSGNWAMLGVVWDAVAAENGPTTRLSVTDNGPGATWTRLAEQTRGAAGLDGVTVALFLAKLNSALTTGHTVTITNTLSTGVAKAAGLAELSSSGTIVLSTSGANGANAAASTAYSVALSGLTSVAGLYVGIAAAEEELTTAVTVDASYTAIFAASINSGTGGVNASNVIASAGTLANTSTGDTFDRTGLTSSDRAAILVRLEETVGTTYTKQNATSGFIAETARVASGLKDRQFPADTGVAILEATAAGPKELTYSKTGAALMGGPIISEKTGAAVSERKASGADATTSTEAGTASSPHTAAGVRTRTFPADTGSGVSERAGEGSTTVTYTEAGNGAADFAASGVKTYSGPTTYTKAGAGETERKASGADSTLFAAKAGASVSERSGSGTDSNTFTEAGAGIRTHTGSGVQSLIFITSGLGAAPFSGSGTKTVTASNTYVKTGLGILVFTGAGYRMVPDVLTTVTLRSAPATITVGSSNGALRITSSPNSIPSLADG
jgi:fibronectin-binding autotransporter adhesin